ncbi:hypothetical protein GMB34_07245 [Turicibacter sanguinis]|nr:hypothetical protein [Turicibacter sanguinis]MTN83331.1 hypothetical protein [Turicibacter sanguinis]MTN86730.1 hypothetical protein [Turicibacter sanguinis]MTN88896.1 hypothetical protein [Turicibacter sanguinis]MTN91526.1 hypothetical protein [Turicibacter sanguinis]
MHYQVVIKKDHYNGKGSYLQVYVPGVDIQEKFFNNGLATGMIRIDDGRLISAAQRGLLYSLFNDIRIWRGDSHKKIGVGKVKEELKESFCEEAKVSRFSLSNVSMELAGDFIDYVLDFTFVNDIPLTFKTFEVAKTVKNWSYLCFKSRKCTVCGKSHAVVHHLDTVGIGMNRNKVDHSKMLLIMVCQEHHQEAHNIGDETFLRKHKVVGIFVRVATLKVLNIRGDYGEEANI